MRAPLLLMTDQEGGQVRRLPGQPNLSEKQIGAKPLSQAKTLATAAGQGAAANLRVGVGMNVNLAPVLDVYRKAGDFDDQFGRSYSKNPAVVSALGANMIKAQQAGGVAATVKHFPGLGAATAYQNTDMPASHAQPDAGHHPRHRRGAVQDRDQRRGKAGHGVLGGRIPRYRPGRPGSPRKSCGASCGTGSSSPESRSPTRSRPERSRTTAAPSTAPCSPRSAGMDLILASAQNVTQGQQARGELAAAYSKGILGHQAFLASVNRVIALRKSLK